MSNEFMFPVDKRKFVVEVGRVKSKTDMNINDRLDSIGLSYYPYKRGRTKGDASIKTITRLYEAGVDVKKFLQEEDKHLFE